MSTFQLIKIFLRNIKQFLFGKEPFAIEISGFKYKIEPRSDEFLILWEVFVSDVYEPSFDINSVDTILDIGGYTGDFSIWASKRFKPESIYSLEPDKRLFELLVENVNLNGLSHKINCINKALLDGNNASIKKGIIKSTTRVKPGTTRGKIKTITLSDFFSQYDLKIIDYFKMDIEGGEKYVLTERNKEIFKNKVRYISMETHKIGGFTRKDCRKYFEDLGFEIHERRLMNCNTELEALNTQLANKLF